MRVVTEISVIHPEIQKFWEKSTGRLVYGSGDMYWLDTNDDKGDLSNSSRMVAIKYSAIKTLDRTGKFLSVLPVLQDDDWVYPFAGGPRDEATMLRLIKLKAFL
jgi:hypothetical protein